MPIEMGMKASRSGMLMIEQLIERIARPLPSYLDMVERSVRFGFAGNFARQAAGDSPSWAALAPRTQRERTKQGYGATGPILVRTAGYRRSWIEQGGFVEMDYRINGWNMFVGSGHQFVEELEEGVPARNLPARPVRYLDTGQQANIGNALDAIATQIMNGL